VYLSSSKVLEGSDKLARDAFVHSVKVFTSLVLFYAFIINYNKRGGNRQLLAADWPCCRDVTPSCRDVERCLYPSIAVTANSPFILIVPSGKSISDLGHGSERPICQWGDVALIAPSSYGYMQSRISVGLARARGLAFVE